MPLVPPDSFGVLARQAEPSLDELVLALAAEFRELDGPAALSELDRLGIELAPSTGAATSSSRRRSSKSLRPSAAAVTQAVSVPVASIVETDEFATAFFLHGYPHLETQSPNCPLG